MHLTKDQLDEMQNAIDTAPRYSAPQRRLLGKLTSSPPGSVSLLPLLPYIPSERDQGNCGNCWVWASNGALEIEHTVNTGIRDRLSIQYVNSKYQYTTGNYACVGGYVQNFTAFYTTDKSPIPWTNTNASYGDYHPNADGSTRVPYSSIASSPSYSLNTLSNSTVVTFGVENSTAITNIRAALDSHHPVLYFFYLPSAGWTDFIAFWDAAPDTSMFDTSLYGGQEIGGGHGVLIVGYDTTDPDNPYWLVVNSWGSTTNRTDGTYRLNMTMNYSAVAYELGTTYQQNEFEILTPVFVATTPVPRVSSVSPGSGPVAGGNPVTVTGIGFTGATNVTFGGRAAPSFTAATADADSQITVIAPAGTAGTVHVTVANSHGTSTQSAADQYTFTAAPDPASGSGDSTGPSSGSGASVATAPGVPAGQTMTFVYNPPGDDGVAFQIMQVQAIPSEQVGEVSLLAGPVTLGDTNRINGNPAVAGYRQIEPIGVNPGVFASGIISFRVTSSWLDEHKVTPDQLVMLRDHDGTWTQLSTTYVREEGNYYYFTAATPGFSYFAVAVRNTTVVTAASTTVAVSAETTLPDTSVSTGSTAVQTTAVTSHPVAPQTTVVPAPAGSSGFPVTPVIVGIAAMVIVAVGIVVVRRWWVRRQNPALFRDYDK